MANKFKKGDQVVIISGSDKGKIGNITLSQGDRVVVGGVNLRTVHKKPTSNNPGQIMKVEKPIHVSNVSHVEDGKPVKISFKIEEGEGKSFVKKTRISRKTGKKIN